jgi:hypothetical protein
MPQPRHWLPNAGVLVLIGLLTACGGADRGPQAPVSSSRSVTPPGPPHDPWGPWIREASRRYDVPERWIREVMRQESGGRASATSPVGAMGLMQVMPGTYAELRRRHNLGDDPYHPYDNLMAGTAYLRQMYDLYGSPAFLAAYNAGPRRLEDYLYNNRGLPTETRNYVGRVGPRVIQASPVRRAPAEVYAAGEIPLSIAPGPRRMDGSTRAMLAEQRAIREHNAQFAGRAEPEPSPRRPAPAGSAMVAGPYVPSGESRVIVARMDPIPDGSTPEGAARLAESGGRVAGLLGGDGRVVVARMDPIPDGSTPEGAARLAETAARQAPPEPMRGSEVGRERLAPPVPASQAPLAAAPARGARGLSFISTAQAGTLPAGFRPPTPPAPRPSAPASAPQWGVQLGAFASEGQAQSAAQQAQGTVGGRSLVQPVTVGRSKLYRARVTGLSQSAAQQACDRLRARGACLVLPPES